MKTISAFALRYPPVPGYSFAAAKALHVTKSVTISTDAAKVWEVVKNFDGLNTWRLRSPGTRSSGTNNKVGAVRLLTLKDGGTIKEKLLACNADAHLFKYSILEGVLPVSSYTSNFAVTAAGKGKATVTWSGNFKRKNVGDKPADNENDKTATDTISAVYQAGLDNLKEIAEAK
jgi:mxaD protein